MVRAFAYGVMGHWIDHSWCYGSLDRSFMVDKLNYFLFQPELHDWCNKGCGMCYARKLAAAGFLS